MPYWQHYRHLVWGTKNREPPIDEELAAAIACAVQAKCNEHRVTLHATGIMPEHLHLAVSIPPRLAIADFVRMVKGASSYQLNTINRLDRLARFEWQAEYGLISFGERSLESVVAYINNQAAHHAEDALWPTFEILDSIPPGSARE